LSPSILSPLRTRRVSTVRMPNRTITYDRSTGTGRVRYCGETCIPVGEMDEVPDGQGEMDYEQSRYVGEWDQGKRHGRGVQEWFWTRKVSAKKEKLNSTTGQMEGLPGISEEQLTKKTYHGEWVADKYCGRGVLVKHLGDRTCSVYVGKLRHECAESLAGGCRCACLGKPNGNGVEVFDLQEQQLAQVLSNIQKSHRLASLGEAVCVLGQKVELACGDEAKLEAHEWMGEGAEEIAALCSGHEWQLYSGAWENGKLSGRGVLRTSDNVKIGFFEQDMLNGQGLLRDFVGDPEASPRCGPWQWEGTWKDGTRHGQGVFTEDGEPPFRGVWEDDVVTTRCLTESGWTESAELSVRGSDALSSSGEGDNDLFTPQHNPKKTPQDVVECFCNCVVA